ncbi:Equilibrative nucleoside transporter 3 [Intoshia linei]|uniref:Equilibrative nucleoside transporter 3 n=1 Tax=Intoshia linei TaxID=1819745 RepID=A0A177B236_9BILA|nr:Equilibrative nucleoside transporter 3 [Intoshia linei]
MENSETDLNESINEETPLQPNQIDFNVNNWNFLLYFSILANACTVLIPYNIFVSSYNYYVNYKLKYKDQPINELNKYQQYFISWIGVSCQSATVFMVLVNTVSSKINRISLYKRVMGSMVGILFFCIVSIVLARMDSSEWIPLFFALNVALAFITSIATAIYQNSLYGLISIFPYKYVNGAVLGNNISGFISTIMLLIATKVSKDDSWRQTYFYLFALILLIIGAILLNIMIHSILLLFALGNTDTKIYHYYKLVDTHENQNTSTEGVFKKFKFILEKGFDYYIAMFMLYVVTLCIFPAMLVYRKSPIYENEQSEYFKTNIVYLNFATFSIVGSWLANYYNKITKNCAILFVTIRFLLILYFIFSNIADIYGNNVNNILNSDGLFGFVCAFTGLTNSFMTSVLFMKSVKLFQDKHTKEATMLMSVFLLVGIIVGLLLGTFMIYIVTLCH